MLQVADLTPCTRLTLYMTLQQAAEQTYIAIGKQNLRLPIGIILRVVSLGVGRLAVQRFGLSGCWQQ